MNKYLLDTDICVHFLQGKFRLVEKIDAVGKASCMISEITIAELLFGAENSARRSKHLTEVREIEEQFQILPIYPAFKIYAKEKARLRKKGTVIAEFDLLIGSTALFNDLTVATGNQKHFSRIDNIKL